ncbi:hypothetical protein K474DRAFT_1667005 [Panus rudis PR-1116 ss-1]|nr:hypothetical protein K474DRAFT_1667005 [Panus rudis PR-1116 ss-1]
MSSSEDTHDSNPTQVAKKRRVRTQRACDNCRRKKIRCDGGQDTLGNVCSNCITHNLTCTYQHASKKRGYPREYVENLERTVEEMEELLKKLCTEEELQKELGDLPREPWYTDRGKGSQSQITAAETSAQDSLPPSDDEMHTQRTLTNSLMHYKNNPVHVRYVGKSSDVMLMRDVIEARKRYTGSQPFNLNPKAEQVFASMRPEFWTSHPWITSELKDPDPHPEEHFPPPDLLKQLVELYFVHVNDYNPLLHRPTFERQIAEKLHLRDEGFGTVLLFVCALGSLFSGDPRVLLDYPNALYSRGWKYFETTRTRCRSIISPPRLYDLQLCALGFLFMQGSSAPHACWTVAGIGIRMAQDVGAHRRKVYSNTATVEEELWKRAFWVLVCMDRSVSMIVGRALAIRDEDIDLDFPVECDDEYWVIKGNEVKFRQPPGKPSKIAYFNCMIRLHQIIAFALRTIYSINKSKVLLGFMGKEWEQNTVAELDSALNKWVDSVPDHLRWDPYRTDTIFLSQSAMLYALYYQTQITVHRPFIPTPGKPSPLSYPSLAICTNAARSCVHVVDVVFRRIGCHLDSIGIGNVAFSMFNAAVVILLNIWAGKKSGLKFDPAKEMEEVHKCMRVLKSMEDRWHGAGRLWDILYDLAYAGDLPLPPGSPTLSQKRERDEDEEINGVSIFDYSSDSPSSSPFSDTAQTPSRGGRHIAGSKRVAQRQHPQPSPSETQASSSSTSNAPEPSVFGTPEAFMPNEFNDMFELPTHSDQLGRIPIHPGMNNTDPFIANGWYTGEALSLMSDPNLTAEYGPSSASTCSVPPSNDGFSTFAPPVASTSSSSEAVFTPMNLHDRTPGQLAGEASMSSMPSNVPSPPFPSSSFPAGLFTSTFPQTVDPTWPSGRPPSLEWDEWMSYLNNVSGLMQQAQNDTDRPQP